jgi:hypothetical protein
MRSNNVTLAIAILFAILAAPLRGEVIESTAGGFIVRNTATINAPPAKVYAALTDSIGGWWDLRALDADVPLYNISTLERLSQQSRWTQRAVSSLLGLFASIATLLSAMGLYAVMTHSISRRTSEIGIRMALGAQRFHVAWLFLWGTLVHVGLGLTIGVAGGVAMAQVLRGVLVQTNALDRFTFAALSCCWRWSPWLPA